MKNLAERRLLVHRGVVHSGGLPAVQDSRDAVNIHAAEGDDAGNPTAEGIGQQTRLTLRAEDRVDDGLGRELAEDGLEARQIGAIAGDMFHTAERRYCPAAVKGCDLVALVSEGLSHKSPNETCAADDQNSHIPRIPPDGQSCN